MRTRPLVLFTDFGSTDFYAGVVRAVLASAAPDSSLIDLHHDVPAHDIDVASFVLARAFEYLPHDAVLVAVVDPGVGTARRELIVTIGGRVLVGPDNGLASDLLLAHGARAEFVAVDRAMAQRETGVQVRGSTFHGRDIFAPVAAAVARGVNPARLGERVEGVVMLRGVPGASVDGGVVRGRGRYADRFGNVLTDIPAAMLRSVFADLDRVEATVAGRRAGRLRETYAQGGDGELMVLVNGWGLLEAAINGGRAIDRLGLMPASEISFELRKRD